MAVDGRQADHHAPPGYPDRGRERFHLRDARDERDNLGLKTLGKPS